MNMAGSNKPKQKKICYTTVEVLKTNLTTLKKKDVMIIVDLQKDDQPKEIEVVKKPVVREHTLKTLEDSKLVQTGRRLFEEKTEEKFENDVLKKTEE